MNHTCHARGCPVAVKPELLMCLRHWRLVPTKIKRAVWQHYRAGQCDDKRVTREWLQAADAAIGYVASTDGLPLSANERSALAVFGVKPREPKRPASGEVVLQHKLYVGRCHACTGGLEIGFTAAGQLTVAHEKPLCETFTTADPIAFARAAIKGKRAYL